MFSNLLAQSYKDYLKILFPFFGWEPWKWVKYILPFVTLLSLGRYNDIFGKIWQRPLLSPSPFFFARTFTKLQDCGRHCWCPTQTHGILYPFCVPVLQLCALLWMAAPVTLFWQLSLGYWHCLICTRREWKCWGFLSPGVALGQRRLRARLWKPASPPSSSQILRHNLQSRAPCRIRMKVPFPRPCSKFHLCLTASFSIICSPHPLWVSCKSSSLKTTYTWVLILGSGSGELV